MAFEEKTLASEVVYEGKIFNIRRDTVETVNGKTSYRDILEHNGASVMIPVTSDNKIILVKQWRQTLKRQVWELPAGKVDPGEDFETAAIRELKEETGCTAEKITYLLTINPSVGYSEEMLAIYLCEGLSEGETSFDDTEDLDIKAVPADEVVEEILAGKIVDSKTVAGVLFARMKGYL